MHPLDNVTDQARHGLGRGRGVAHLGHHVQALAPRALVVDADGGRVAHAVDAVDDLFDVGGDDVLAAQDDQVLEAPGDVKAQL